MRRKRVFLRADAGKNIGFGHFVRSLALASYLKDSFDCTFWTFNPELGQPTDYQLAEIEKVCGYRHISVGSMTEYDNAFVDVLSGDEIVVLDNYYFSTSYQQRIKAAGCRLVCLDDVHDRHMVADVVFTFSPAKKERFSLEPYTQFYGGIEWTFLRPPFLVKPAVRHYTAIPRNIVLAVGGADPFGLTNKLIELLLSINDRLQVQVIAGDTVEISTKYTDRIKEHRRVSAEEIVRIFAGADLGIFPASTICVEALSQGLPVAAGWYMDNQKEGYCEGVRKGLFLPLGNFLDSDNDLKGQLEKTLKTAPVYVEADIDFKRQREAIIKIFRDL